MAQEITNETNELIHQPSGFDFGFTAITKIEEKEFATGINFGILKLKAREEKDLTSQFESAYLLMHGEVIFYYDGKSYHAKRTSIFDEDPIAIHFARDNKVIVKAISDAEIAVSAVENNQQFPTQVFDATNMLESEKRGKGILDDTSYRIVRTIFDNRNRKEANLVLGEVITFPGRWSSYPPHHHPQPEIYHYRFTEPQGYGISQLGEKFLKVAQYDTLKILDLKDHAQVAAPGYGMYYIWVIRHLANNRYSTPEFAPEHVWAKDISANQKVWRAKNI
ncbi:MAG: 5-deoxy-glucuronate isomerase [Gammaproteobacteria bacterium]|nr:5-deoxy-glucuronate isomerase [Gammaproteobacteria bacterium]